MTTHTAGRLHHLDTLRAFIMSFGVVLHAGLVAPSSVSKAVGFVSSTFRMNLFVFIAGFFVALLRAKRPANEVLRDRLIRFGIPAIVVISTVSWIDHYYFINLLAGRRSFAEIASAPFAWNIAGFDWGKVPKFVTWHGQLWFLIVVILYCLAAGMFFRLASFRPIKAGIEAIERDSGSAIISALVAITMAFLFLGGRVVHFLTTQQVLGGGPFNFIAQQMWIYSAWFLLGIIAFRSAGVYRLMHRFHPWNTLVAAFLLFIAVLIDAPVRSRFGMIGGEVVEYFSKGIMGFYICAGLLWIFNALGNRPSHTVKFVSEASYTVYLFHMAVISALGFYFNKLVLPSEIRWLLVIAFAYPTCLLVHWGIISRSRVLEFVFNGKPLARATAHT